LIRDAEIRDADDINERIEIEMIWLKKTCLFTNNALFDSKCFVSKIREIRDSIDSSWIFALLTLTVSIRIVWARFVDLTTLLLEMRWKFVNVRSSLENMTISLRLNFNETSCETTLNRMIICRFWFFICVIIVCQFRCVDEIMRKIIKYCLRASTRVTAKESSKAKTAAKATSKTTVKEHRSDFDDSDDADSRNEILFWKSFWKSFWDAKSSSLFTLLNEKWISRNDKQSMTATTSLIDVCLTKKNEMSSTFVDFVLFIFC
jgi:hypothetical protein